MPGITTKSLTPELALEQGTSWLKSHVPCCQPGQNPFALKFYFWSKKIRRGSFGSQNAPDEMREPNNFH